MRRPSNYIVGQVVQTMLLAFVSSCGSTKEDPGAITDAGIAADAAKATDGRAPLTNLCGVTTTYTSVSDVAYATVDMEQRINLRIPDGPGPFPALVYVHGGAWSSGSYRGSSELEEVATRGYVFANVGYRLSGTAKAPAQIQDVKAAIRFLRAHAGEYKIDPSRIGISGVSAGGHLAALAGTSGAVESLEDLDQGNPTMSSRVQAVADFFGPTDFPLMDPQAIAQGCVNANHGRSTSGVSQLVGCAVSLCPDKAQLQNPITYVGNDDPPFFIAHGLLDCTVPWAQSEILDAALVGAGVASTFNKVARGEHGPGMFNKDTVDRAYNFLDQVLKGCAP
jgi:acetyl esterase/lipase